MQLRKPKWIASAVYQLILLMLSTAIILGVSGYYISSTYVYVRSLFVNITAGFVVLAVGVWGVNDYLRRQKKTLKSLMLLVVPTIANVDKTITDKIQVQFPKNGFGCVIKKYNDGCGRVQSLSQTDRDHLWNVIKDNRECFVTLFKNLSSDLTDLAHIIGWSFDPVLLGEVIACRSTATKFVKLNLDDSDDNACDACKLFLDTYLAEEKILWFLQRRNPYVSRS